MTMFSYRFLFNGESSGCNGRLRGFLFFCRGVFAAVNDYFCGAFGSCGFDCIAGFIFCIVHAGKIVVDYEQIRLFFADSAGNAADFAHSACGFAVFLIIAGDHEHRIVSERHHLDQSSGTSRYAGAAAGAFFIIHG